MRVRLAGQDQVGSHTPRPQAPADSLASFQIHESVINNVVERLDLDGRTFRLPELSRHIAACLSRPAPGRRQCRARRREDHFRRQGCGARAPRRREGGSEPVHRPAVEKARGVEEPHRPRFYKPEINGPSAELVREGIIQLSGKRLDLGSQIALRGVFSRAFSKKSPWNLTPEELLCNPKLADVGVSQFVIDDGWIGVALAPGQHTATRSGLLRK